MRPTVIKLGGALLDEPGAHAAAFDALAAAVDSEPDPAKRARILLGVLGAEGPTIYATATAVNEGIDHAWVFRYEIEESPE